MLTASQRGVIKGKTGGDDEDSGRIGSGGYLWAWGMREAAFISFACVLSSDHLKKCIP
jgi:hypothetical protein